MLSGKLKYLPSILISICLPWFMREALGAAGDSLDIPEYLLSIKDLNADSSVYLAISFMECLIIFAISILILLLYKLSSDKLPFNFKVALLMQFPLTLTTIRHIQNWFDVSTIYAISDGFTYFALSSSIIISYVSINKYYSYKNNREIEV